MVRTEHHILVQKDVNQNLQGNTTDMELASLNSDMAMACEIKHDDKLTDEDGVYIQVKPANLSPST